ncbi:hypothetical protein ACWGJP_13150 [Microbacterium sp. NPDC055903]
MDDHSAETTPRRRGLAVSALVAAIAMPVVAVTGYLVAAATPGIEALGVAAIAVMAVLMIGMVALVLGILAVALSRPRALAIWGLSITVAAAVALVLFIVPFGS